MNPLAQILQMYLRLCSRSSSSDNVFLGSVLCFRVFREYLLFAILLYASLETIPFSGCCIIDELQVSCDSELFSDESELYCTDELSKETLLVCKLGVIKYFGSHFSEPFSVWFGIGNQKQSYLICVLVHSLPHEN